MNTAEKVKYWLGIADYDLDTAEAMYSTGRWLYVAFMCHQVIEKTLKAYWCATQEDEPPYIHNHKRLADGCGLYSRMSLEQKDFLKPSRHTISRHAILRAGMRLRENLTRMHVALLSTTQKQFKHG